MARDDEGDGIASQSLTNVAGCGRLAQGFGKVAVGAGFACGDFSSGFINLPGKRVGSVQVHRDVAKILKFAVEVFADLPDDLGDLRWRGARFARAGASRDSRFGHRRGCFRKLKQGHGRRGGGISGVAPGNAARAERRLEEAVGEALHGISFVATDTGVKWRAERGAGFASQFSEARPGKASSNRCYRVFW